MTTVKQGKATNCLAGEEEKLAKLAERLDKASTAYGMETSAEKTKLMRTTLAASKRRGLRKKRFQLEGSEKYKEVKNNIKRCMKKAKENWIGGQCVRLKKI